MITTYLGWTQSDNRQHPNQAHNIHLIHDESRDDRDVPGSPWVMDLSVMLGALKDAHRSMYIVDTGTEIITLWVTGFSSDGLRLTLDRFPLSTGTRPDNGRPVDMSNWVLGPTRAYHLKVRPSVVDGQSV